MNYTTKEVQALSTPLSRIALHEDILTGYYNRLRSQDIPSVSVKTRHKREFDQIRQADNFIDYVFNRILYNPTSRIPNQESTESGMKERKKECKFIYEPYCLRTTENNVYGSSNNKVARYTSDTVWMSTDKNIARYSLESLKEKVASYISDAQSP